MRDAKTDFVTFVSMYQNGSYSNCLSTRVASLTSFTSPIWLYFFGAEELIDSVFPPDFTVHQSNSAEACDVYRIALVASCLVSSGL